MAAISQLIFLIMVTTIHCYCPREKIYDTGKPGECSYRIYCIETITGVSLREECQASINYPVNVDLVLTEAKDVFDESTIDPEFLYSVTALRASGRWPTTNLSLLQYMPRLQNLSLTANHIRYISPKPFYSLSRLENLDLSRNQLKDVKDLFRFETHPNKMKKLNLAYNNIQEIAGDVLNELTSLVELDLSFNYIVKLDEELLANLTNLETLKLSNNKILDLNGALNNLRNLKHLYIRNNQLININEESLQIIKHLETFDVSTNQLQNVTSDMFFRHWDHFSGHSICKIVLSGNYIVSVPNTTIEDDHARKTRSYSIDVLTELDLSRNAITEIEYDAFRSLVRLTSLDLSCNRIINFMINPNDLEYVMYLNLSRNYITHLYFDSFISMTNLHNLDISHNELDIIPEHTFENNYMLKYVNMTNNVFRVLKHIHIKIFHPTGGRLDLSNNTLSRLTIPAGEGMRMRTLILRSNNISEVMFVNLQHQMGLEHVDMSKNFIEILNASSLHLPVTVSYLDLSYNRIQEIGPSTFRRIGHLRSLHLSNNELTSIDYGAFQGLISLVNLNLSFNKITSLDSKVLLDLKSLEILSIRSNNMYHLDYKSWIGLKSDLNVYVDDNNFSCEWLGTALSDYNNNYSKMKPCVLVQATSENSLEGIPCVDKSELALYTNPVMTNEERILAVNLQILEAIKEQTYFLKKYMGGATARS